MTASVSCGCKDDSMLPERPQQLRWCETKKTAVLNVVSESMKTDPEHLVHSLPLHTLWGGETCGVVTWVSGVGWRADTKHALMWHRLTLLQPGGPVRGIYSRWACWWQTAQRRGSSYRSGVTFSGQGRLKDILAWDKAQGLVNLKDKKINKLKLWMSVIVIDHSLFMSVAPDKCY